MTKSAKLRVCGRCEWIFKQQHTSECPRCGFGSYGARFVYGDAAYRFAKNQKPWVDKQVHGLRVEVKKAPCCYTATHTRGFRHDSECRNNPTDVF